MSSSDEGARGARDEVAVQDAADPAHTYRRGFMFWSLAPFLVLFLIVMGVMIDKRGSGQIVVLCGVEGAALCLLLGLWNPYRFWWAWRLLGAIVFLAYLLYGIEMFIEGRFVGAGRRSETTLVNAVLGMIAFGLPGLCYAVFGRLSWRAEAGGENEDSFDDEDESEPK